MKPLILLDDALLDRVREEARRSSHKRAVHRFHEKTEPVGRRLYAIEPESYVRPHRHEFPDRVEALVALRGRAAILTYSDGPTPSGGVIIAARGSARGVEVPPQTWHSLVSLEPGTVLYEVGEGPCDSRTDSVWAPWSPEEGTAEGSAYLEELKRIIGL